MITGINTIIFDFGGVLLNLNESVTTNLLKEILDLSKCNDLLEMVITPYEKGEISEEAFFNRLQRRSKTVLSGDKYFEIWNAMLLDMPVQRLEMLKRLKKKYRLILLSNTNITHIRNVLRYLKNQYQIENFNSFFDFVFYSHDIHLRKPDPEIFNYVIEYGHINPSQTLFIDDKKENTDAASTLGFKVWNHPQETNIDEIIDRVIQENNG